VEQAIAANVEIAKSAERVAAETTKAEKLRNDTCLYRKLHLGDEEPIL
jgi:hypothetical protein